MQAVTDGESGQVTKQEGGTCGAEADSMDRVPVGGLQPPEAAHVRLHAIEVKHAQAVVPAA